jgi:Na+/proline symporter
MMVLNTIDWVIICFYLVITLIIGLWFKRRASKGMSDYFLGGRKLPWLIAGLSMVATTFAADTPLAVTELIRQNGISGNWLWWNFIIGGMITTFFFARLWRRANVLTELEFIELRYSGKEAAVLRGIKSVYMGLLINILFIGWVNLALVSILEVFFDIPSSHMMWYVATAMILSASYATLSGLLGVAYADAFQFVLSLIGAVLLAIIVVNSDQIGGIAGLKANLPTGSLNFFPEFNTAGSGGITSTLSVSFAMLFAYLGVQWWASIYPGAEPGGGGFIAQRMMSTRSESDSFKATMFFQIAHYTIRPWPWIVVGLATIVLYPNLAEGEARLGYVLAIKDFAPAGIKGLLLVSLLAAYMSTISTVLNLSSSYLVNDLYKRFLVKSGGFGSEESANLHFVKVGRIVTLLIVAVSLYATTLFTSISEVWLIVLEGTAGLGLVMMLRWFWWRINAWSEITATIVPIITFSLLKFNWDVTFPYSLFITVSITTISWLIVTFLTRPTDEVTLDNFCRVVRPEFGWKSIYSRLEIAPVRLVTSQLLFQLVFAIILTYSILFLVGKIIFQEFSSATLWFAIGLVSFFGLYFSMKKSK